MEAEELFNEAFIGVVDGVESFEGQVGGFTGHGEVEEGDKGGLDNVDFHDISKGDDDLRERGKEIGANSRGSTVSTE